MSIGIFEILGLLATIFWIWMIIDCATHERNTTDKIVWIIIIIFTHFLGALIYFFVRKQKRLGDLVELRARTRELIDALMPNLEKLDGMIESASAVNGKLSLDDIRVLPLLRSAAVVKGLRFPHKVRDYFETMMSRIGYQPLPAV